MSVVDKLRDEYGGQLDQLNISIKNNAQLAGLCWELIEARRNLHRTYRDNPTNNRLTQKEKQYRNLAYEQVWEIFSMIVTITEPHLQDTGIKNKRKEDDDNLVKQSKDILKKPMRDTDLKELDRLSVEYYNLLCRKGMFEITPKISSRGAYEKILTG